MMGKGVKSKDFIEQLFIQEEEYIRLDDNEIRTNRDRVDIKHITCGHEWNVSMEGLKKGNRCPKCNGGTSVMTNNEACLETLSYGFELLDEFKGVNYTYRFKHTCGFVFNSKYINIRRRKNCPVCHKCRQYTKEILSYKLKTKNMKLIEYSDLESKILHTCGRELMINRRKYSSLNPLSCICNSNRKGYDEKSILNKLEIDWFNDEYVFIELLDCFNFKYKHKKCGSVETKNVNMFFYHNGMCSSCYESKGEKDISRYLDKMNIEYIQQHIFSGCKYKARLRFDFYLPKQEIVIEYHGKQHYEIVDFFGGQEEYKDRIKRDEIKRKYCSDNFITYIELKYDENIEEILEKVLTKG